MRRSTVVLGLLLLMAMAFAMPAVSAQSDCDIPAREYTVTPDDGFNALWTLRDGAGWTGGDGGFSILLPDGRTVWTFGDTFLGGVDETDTRQRDGFVMIRNSVVVQDGETMTTLRGGTAGAPDSFITPDATETWYWPMDGLVVGDTLYLLWQRFTSPSGDAWDLQAQGTDVQALSLPDLTPVSLTPFEPPASSKDIHWGVEFLPTESHVYIYGIEDLQATKHAYVARFPIDGDLFGAWEYFDGAAWVSDPEAAAIIADVSNSLGVFAADGHYVLISFSPGPFSSRLMLYTACDPAGPWGDGTVIYEAPEAGDKRIVYFPLAHPQFIDESGWPFSYSVNAHNFNDLCPMFACHLEPGGAANYRPRFVRVSLVE